MYRSIPGDVDLPELERDILSFWERERVFERTLEQSEDRPTWVFYEGPPTANGMPGTHHIEARVFKDVFPRYRTMKGYHVPRKAGWDCHGLPVELAVEQELNLSGKRDIERYGIAEFNDRCRESVTRHTDAFAELTRRMGYWVNMDDPYRTMDTSYIESVWWSLKKIFDDGMLEEDFRVAPWCPRCGTGLSDHELAQGYETVVDPSVYVKLPLTSGPLAGRTSLLIWTTTPWTLVSNVAVAVHPDVTYVVATDGEQRLVVAEDLVSTVLDGWHTTGESFSGADMELWEYRAPLDLVPVDGAHKVVNGDYVTTVEGSGLVHQAPAFGADDLATCRAYDLPMVNPIRPDGTFEADVPLVGGVFFKDADRLLVERLKSDGLILEDRPYEHSYPHCWRCHTALIYYAQPSWYIRTTAVKERLLAANDETNWFPPSIKHGRYGDWLENNVDWALSRSRYWGTPLPIWRCGDGHLHCVGSLAELGRLADRDLSALDPHRPYIDEVFFTCHCGKTASRVPEVIDAWYDSGAMPFAQFGYPHHNKELFAQRHPAQFISEAIDQTRGWFYTLMAVGVLVFDRSSYENVVCLGHIMAEDGRKMSKHLGNILEPMSLMERHGADAVRWFMAAVGSPWAPRRVGHTAIQEVVRKVLFTYWNTVSFQAMYARIAGWSPSDADPTPGERPVLDRWLLAELNRLVSDVDAALAAFDTQRAGRLLQDFIDDLSNWYVRRGRRRFWAGDTAALATLHEALTTVTLLMAPMTPFITERVWRDLVTPVTPDAPPSVHLAPFPTSNPELLDETLSRRMTLVRTVVELGRSARAESAVKTRQPLARVLVPGHVFDRLDDGLREQLAAELNVMAVEPMQATSGSLVDATAKANFRTLGRRFGKRVQVVAAAIAATDAARLAVELRDTGATSLDVDGEQVTLTREDVFITETPREGWAVATEGDVTVALDLTVTPALRRAGVARDAVRLIQTARKACGFEVTDRIVVFYQAAGDTAAALAEHAAFIADEVLAAGFHAGEPDRAGLETHEDTTIGMTFRLRKA
ncbi:MAG TPA: isoleucine--tRNA ligase [Candidatus Stackebrandtia excrementipullorum]|nr:isoleucine--tRNA ligase [Candidatus Stackebrandtia excrementipullorum]